MKSLRQWNSQKQAVEWWLPGAEGAGSGDLLCNGYGVSVLQGDKALWRLVARGLILLECSLNNSSDITFYTLCNVSTIQQTYMQKRGYELSTGRELAAQRLWLAAQRLWLAAQRLTSREFLTVGSNDIWGWVILLWGPCCASPASCQ